ncbi:hypothetical protein BROUX41_004184 [Berkeleyomyces rouxiae]|uniref:uncharacterized protein n=1 Tax=Berkeleyomyces rouxiae TaxID=2035830 RepID=UPI003B7A6FBD
MLIPSDPPALQVIVLGSGGGPLESNTTAFLVRSVASGWSKGSIVAVDAGIHLSAISRILEETQPKSLGTDVALPHTLEKGPFAGLEVQNKGALANGARITHDLVDTYLITHPHLDHISGFVVNTAALSATRPKKLAGLPTTISAFKKHIFNNVIWPNLSDENNGVGLVTYMRLVEGGNPALGEGEGKGYVEVNDGLAVKMWSVSHGHCMERHSHRGSTSSQGGLGGGSSIDAGRGSFLHSNNSNGGSHIKGPISNGTGHASHHNGLTRTSSLINQATALAQSCECRERICVYDSSAYFIRDVATAREILIFGDVEPDSLSLTPRNHQVWLEAGPKIACGQLAAIFIECSYDNSQADEQLFGHLKPKYIIEELQALAAQVRVARQESQILRESRKRKRDHNSTLDTARHRKPPPPSLEDQDPVSPKSMRPVAHVAIATPEGSRGTSRISSPVSELSLVDDIEALSNALSPLPPPFVDQETQSPVDSTDNYPLRGVKVVIIHMKERLSDECDVGVTIKKELDELEAVAKLGCEFIISYSGQSLYL